MAYLDLTESGFLDLAQEKYFQQSQQAAMNALQGQQAAMLRQDYERRMRGLEPEYYTWDGAKAMPKPVKAKPKSFREELQHEVDSWLKDAA